MATDLFTVTFTGHLGSDPEMRYTPGGQAVTNFSAASNRQYNDANGQPVKETLWVRVSTWGKLAEICNQYLRKGRRVLVVGRLVPDPQTGGPRLFNRRDGSAGAAFELSAREVYFLDSAEANGAPASAPAQAGGYVDEENIPF